MVALVYACTVFVCFSNKPGSEIATFTRNKCPTVRSVLRKAGIKTKDVRWVEYDDSRVQLDTVAKDQSTLIVYLRSNEAETIRHRRFVLERNEDETGVSGTGIVCEGVVFSNGKVAVSWTTARGVNSVTIHDCIEQVEEIHGHNGKTVLKYLD